MDNIQLDIRKMKMEDIATATDLFILTYSGEPWYENWNYDDAFQRVKDYFISPNSKCYLCYAGEHVIGGLLCQVFSWHEGKQIEIKEFFISPEYQSKGIGSMLMKHMEDEAKQEQIGEIFFWTARNPKLIRFYERHGCNISDDIVQMSKKINY